MAWRHDSWSATEQWGIHGSVLVVCYVIRYRGIGETNRMRQLAMVQMKRRRVARVVGEIRVDMEK